MTDLANKLAQALELATSDDFVDAYLNTDGTYTVAHYADPDDTRPYTHYRIDAATANAVIEEVL